MLYSEPLFRPPSEARSLIVQLTEGCRYNRCLFCAMYKSKIYREKELADFENHLEALHDYYPPDIKRAFIGDGDVMEVESGKLESALERIKRTFPDVNRYGVYGSVFSLKKKSVDDLKRLFKLGLRTVYLGIESGDERVLKRMKKFYPFQKTVAECRKVLSAGIRLSVMVIVGLGGREWSAPHAAASAAIINQIEPTYTSLLNFMLEYTSFQRDDDFARFDFHDYIREVREFVSRIECRTIFRSNHASNPVALAGVLPRDREKMVKILNRYL